MSEEEKAIERFKRKIERADKDILKFSDVYTTLDIHNLRLLLNLIEKQQKEIEKLKRKKYIFDAETNELKEIPIDNNYISKDKIRQFIKEELPDDEIMECCDTYDTNGVYLRKKLQELLEDDNNEKI